MDYIDEDLYNLEELELDLLEAELSERVCDDEDCPYCYPNLEDL
jgi:hypothetical protein